jgi:trigger factor
MKNHPLPLRMGILRRIITLKIEQQYLDNHQVKLIVEIEPAPLEEAKQRAARKLSQRTKIPGFRPGKAPYPIVLRTIGEETILEEALDLLVKEIYPKVIEEAKIKPYGPGSLENMPKLDPPTFEFIVPLEAEVTLGDYIKVRFPYKLKSITKKDINRVLDDLRDRQVILEPVDRPAQPGDQVFIILNVRRTQPSDGETANLVNDRRMPVVIAPPKTGNKDEWPFPGFSHRLNGYSKGDEKTFTYTYPEDADFETLRGKEAEFQVKVEEVKSRTLPELTDEFAQSVGEQFDSLATLTEDIRKTLERQSKEEYDSTYNDKIMDELLKDATIKYPPQMLDHETDLFIDQLENRLAQQNLDMETYLKMRKIDADSLRVETKPLAEQRLKRTLVLLEIAKAQDIHVEDSELEAETMRTLDELSHIMTPEKARKTLTNEFVRGMIGNIGADLLIKHTWDYLQSIARGESDEEKIEKKQNELKNETQASDLSEKPKKKRTTRKVEKNEPK